MTVFQAILLGFVQGMTEFLPVSSSGHLVIFQEIFGFGGTGVTFEVVAHAGTLVSVLVYFNKRLFTLGKEYFWPVVIATIPTAVIGFLLRDLFETFFSSLLVTGFGLVFTSMVLYGMRVFEVIQSSSISRDKALLIGFFQAIAIIPGVSRAGTTIAASTINGIAKEDAFNFSFLLSIPAILGAVVLQLSDTEVSSILTPQNIAGFVSAAIFGLFALVAVKKLLLTRQFYYFSFYTGFFGIAIIFLSLYRILVEPAI